MAKNYLLSRFCVSILMVAFSALSMDTASAASLVNDVSSSVAFLQKDKTASSNITGTGIFVSDGSTFFLVTARHIAEQMSSGSSATILAEDNKPFTSKLSKLYGHGGEAKWAYHDNADVAVLPVNLDCDAMHKLVGHVIDRKFLSSKLALPARGETLTVIGFPSGDSVQDKFTPTSKEAKVAREVKPVLRSDIKREDIFFMIDNADLRNFYGAPVCRVSGASVECVGIVYGSVPNETDDKFVAVIPSTFISEAIDKAIAADKKP